MTFQERQIDIGLSLNIREWNLTGAGKPFLLVHGLASNARTWDGVAGQLAAAGHPVVAVDQRGHGLSDKPDSGYDFATVTSDLVRLIAALGWDRPVLAGQSWGGNVALAFGANYPGTASHLIFVDGGFLDLSKRGSWDDVARDLRPPALAGTPRTALKQRMQTIQPDWDDAGIEATLANFETLPDGTIRPWLTLERHMAILKALYEQQPTSLYAAIHEPVLICVANDGSAWSKRKLEPVEAALSTIPVAEANWFDETAHDIHVHRPVALAQRMLDFVAAHTPR